MDDSNDLWDGLAALVPLACTPPTTPPPTTTTSSSPDWSLYRPLPLPIVTQVRLDGELADHPDPLSLLQLPVAEGRITKRKVEPIIDPPLLSPVSAAPSQPSLVIPPVRPLLSPPPLPHVPQNLVPTKVAPKPILRPPPVKTESSIPDITPSLKEKRAREARQFPREALGSLDGTTSAEVRKMNATERELVLYKRKLRNRESARRSRQKRQATLTELQEEIDDLMQVSGRMVEVGISLREENDRLRDRLKSAIAEVNGLRNLYANDGLDPPATSAMKMKLGG